MKTNLQKEFLKQVWRITCSNCKEIDLRQFMLFAKYCAIKDNSLSFLDVTFTSTVPLLRFTDPSIENLKMQLST